MNDLNDLKIWMPQKKQKAALVRQEFEILFGGARGGGKRICDDELIFTNSGWKRIGDITYSDLLLAPDGTYTKIKGIYRSFSRQMYEIIFDDQATLKCDAEHLWLTKTGKHGKRDGWKIRNIKEILNFKDTIYIPTMYGYAPGKQWNGSDPYIFGLILGDGTLTGAYTTIYSADFEICDYLKNNGWKIYNYGRTVNMCQLTNNESFRNILGKCIGAKKVVPEILLFSDSNSRLSLLQGLMDSDGSIDKDGRCTFVSISENLVTSVKYIVQSLGGKATISIKNKKSQMGGQDWYFCVRITHGGKFNPFRLKRKSNRVIKNQKGCLRTIISIKKSYDSFATCFEVEHPNHLYVVKDFIVTHNTSAGMAWLLYNVQNEKFRALVIRRNADDLRDWIDRARSMYSGTGVQVVSQPVEFRFPSGAVIRTGHLKDENAYEKYQGHEYHNILIEELTHIAREENYLRLITSCRSTVDGLKPQIFATTNPGNIGHEWVKARFINVAHPGETYIDPRTGRSRIFIPAKVEDNPMLMEKDPDYVKFLEGLPDGLRQQWRDGSWENYEVEGAIYAAELTQMDKENRITIVPHETGLPVFTYWDLGVGDYTSIWFVQFVGHEIRLIDFYQNSGYGLPHYIQVLKEKNYVYSEHWAPHDIEVREFTSGKSRYETAKSLGITFKIQPKLSIEDGINAVRMIFNKLWIDREKCKDGIYALKNYRREFDDKHRIYKDIPVHDFASHPADALRGLAVSYRRPIQSEESIYESYSKYDLI